MKIDFFKYQGTGNDFVIIDNRNLEIDLSKEQIEKICNRHFGVGADGLMLLENDNNFDFKMRYFNSDGAEVSMCGNGGRCIVAFAKKMNLISSLTKFTAVDGIHNANIISSGIVELEMIDVSAVKKISEGFFLDTGVPHFVKFVNNVKEIEVRALGKEIRNSSIFSPEGCNVNFVEEISSGKINVRTYERGVEDETLSCGTGVVASSISYYLKNNISEKNISIQTLGGELSVCFVETKSEIDKNTSYFKNIWLSGPAEFVFSGSLEIN